MHLNSLRMLWVQNETKKKNAIRQRYTHLIYWYYEKINFFLQKITVDVDCGHFSLSPIRDLNWMQINWNLFVFEEEFSNASNANRRMTKILCFLIHSKPWPSSSETIRNPLHFHFQWSCINLTKWNRQSIYEWVYYYGNFFKMV